MQREAAELSLSLSLSLSLALALALFLPVTSNSYNMIQLYLQKTVLSCHRVPVS